MTSGRKICWPAFDLICLQGECIHCSDFPRRPVKDILKSINGTTWPEERKQKARSTLAHRISRR